MHCSSHKSSIFQVIDGLRDVKVKKGTLRDLIKQGVSSELGFGRSNPLEDVGPCTEQSLSCADDDRWACARAVSC